MTLYLCAWHDGQLDGPASCVNRSTTSDPASSRALAAAYRWVVGVGVTHRRCQRPLPNLQQEAFRDGGGAGSNHSIHL